MMKLKNQTIDLGLSGYDELFMTEQERADTRKPKVEELPLSELTPFKNHPFKVKNDAEMAELMKSIADAGVLSPAMARPKKGGGYELISGHRRLAACKTLGMDTMPVIIPPFPTRRPSLPWWTATCSGSTFLRRKRPSHTR